MIPEQIRPGYSTCSQLKGMLSQGWCIEPPVYVRPHWRPRSRHENTYHFVLWNGTRVHLVSIPDGPEVQEFLAENPLPTDKL
ncbi:MAG: hypothetical protein JW900_07475 [Anaerolineae bacterium]|nr:hypothetical protein [Anaerolineae bacterium]